MTGGVTVALTDHAVERFRQRVGTRRGGFDVRPEIAGCVSEAWAAQPPPGGSEAAVRGGARGGSVYVRDLVDRGVIIVLPPRPRVPRAARRDAVGGRPLRPPPASTSASPMP